jgi:hypothetical protein
VDAIIPVTHFVHSLISLLLNTVMCATGELAIPRIPSIRFAIEHPWLVSVWYLAMISQSRFLTRKH